MNMVGVALNADGCSLGDDVADDSHTPGYVVFRDSAVRERGPRSRTRDTRTEHLSPNQNKTSRKEPLLPCADPINHNRASNTFALKSLPGKNKTTSLISYSMCWSGRKFRHLPSAKFSFPPISYRQNDDELGGGERECIDINMLCIGYDFMLDGPTA